MNIEWLTPMAWCFIYWTPRHIHLISNRGIPLNFDWMNWISYPGLYMVDFQILWEFHALGFPISQYQATPQFKKNIVLICQLPVATCHSSFVQLSSNTEVYDGQVEEVSFCSLKLSLWILHVGDECIILRHDPNNKKLWNYLLFKMFINILQYSYCLESLPISSPTCHCDALIPIVWSKIKQNYLEGVKFDDNFNELRWQIRINNPTSYIPLCFLFLS